MQWKNYYKKHSKTLVNLMTIVIVCVTGYLSYEMLDKVFKRDSLFLKKNERSNLFILVGLGISSLVFAYFKDGYIDELLDWLYEDESRQGISGYDSVVTLKNWPKEGKIVFKDVCLKYRPETERVLKELSFSVDAG